MEDLGELADVYLAGVGAGGGAGPQPVAAADGQVRRQPAGDRPGNPAAGCAAAAGRGRAGELWQEHGLVFTTTVGTPYESHNLRRDFRRVTAAAGLGARWVPKELRTSFVSMMSYQGVQVEEIARLAGHASSYHRSRLPA
jgi:integrase